MEWELKRWTEEPDICEAHYFFIMLYDAAWTIGVLGFDSRRGLGIFLFTTTSRTALGPTQPPIQWIPGALSLGVKRPVREADHSPPSSAEVKEWVEPYLHSPIRLYGVVFRKKAQGQLYLYLYTTVVFRFTIFGIFSPEKIFWLLMQWWLVTSRWTYLQMGGVHCWLGWRNSPDACVRLYGRVPYMCCNLGIFAPCTVNPCSGRYLYLVERN
jgi:hypothetical protein